MSHCNRGSSYAFHLAIEAGFASQNKNEFQIQSVVFRATHFMESPNLCERDSTVIDKKEATPMMQNEVATTFFEQDLSLKAKQQKNKRNASVDYDPEKHAKPA